VDGHGAGHRHCAFLSGGRRLQLCLVSAITRPMPGLLKLLAGCYCDSTAMRLLIVEIFDFFVLYREQIQEVQARADARQGGGGGGGSDNGLGRSRQPVDEFDQLGTSLEGATFVMVL